MLGWIEEDDIPGFNWPTKTNLTGKENNGRPLSFNFLNPSDIVYIGIRDIDPDEHFNLKKYNIKCFTPDHIEKFGISKVLEKAVDYLDPKNEKSPIHVSFDIDALDPSIAYGTGIYNKRYIYTIFYKNVYYPLNIEYNFNLIRILGTRAIGGLSYREINFILR